jgi:hypothetical protein
MFLGGRERGFTDDKTATRPQLGFHGAYHVAAATEVLIRSNDRR